MPQTEDVLTPILNVERIEEDFYRGIATPGGQGRSFGGQVIAQALMAATRTVGDDRRNHSLHVYFMRPGNAAEPVLYRVSRDMDGRSFATRRVVAIQSGKPILNMAASFQVQDGGVSHADAFPEGITPPEDLPSDRDLAREHLERLGPRAEQILTSPRPIEVRPVGPCPPFDLTPRSGTQYRWIRTCFPMPDDPQLHRAALAYTSDLGLIQTALTVHGKAWNDPGAKVASLDHALWIHEDFRIDDWLLYAMDSPWSGNARGMTFGKIFARDGRLIASVAQEGMIRVAE
ncbi:acyl-CoA thioesterase II [Pseudooceanicola sp. HF7]|uniref:acyl-CoA thioesterase n=1 Tax=Pseudooceanicola sp. HF7 TaxID=2721560 RepID=UPI0020CA4750|nr:acyl-CoA thioesterase II [Pseudooceanicola sp. HF7]